MGGYAVVVHRCAVGVRPNPRHRNEHLSGDARGVEAEEETVVGEQNTVLVDGADFPAPTGGFAALRCALRQVGSQQVVKVPVDRRHLAGDAAGLLGQRLVSDHHVGIAVAHSSAIGKSRSTSAAVRPMDTTSPASRAANVRAVARSNRCSATHSSARCEGIDS